MTDISTPVNPRVRAIVARQDAVVRGAIFLLGFAVLVVGILVAACFLPSRPRS